MPELRNLDVQWVSLVDRAAVRDPSSPEEPQRFLLWKAEATEDVSTVTDDPAETVEQAQGDLQEQLTKMQEQIDALIASRNTPVLSARTDMPTPPSGGTTAEEATVSKNDEEPELSPKTLVEQLLKADSTADSRAIGARYLAEMSPAAHAAWVHGQRHLGATYPGVPVLKADQAPLDPASIRARAVELQKSDASLDEYSAAIKAMQEDKAAQAAYLNSVR